MKYCPECGGALEPGDSFCINCGAALKTSESPESTTYSPAYTTGDYSPKPEKKRRKNPWVAILSVFAALAVIALAVFLVLRSSNPAVLLRAANATIEDLEEKNGFKGFDVLADGGSIQASADLTQYITGLDYLDSLDAKVNAEAYYSKADAALVIDAAASVSGLSALDATVWITPDAAVISSSALLGSKTYRINLDEFYGQEDIPEIIRVIFEKTAGSPEATFSKLLTGAFRYGESYKNKFSDHTDIRLTLDRKALEKLLHNVYGVNADISPACILRFDFTINSNNRLTGITLSTDQISYSLNINPSSASGDLFTGELISEDYNAEMSWNPSSGAFKLSSGGINLTPGVNVVLQEQTAPKRLPGITEEISLYDEEDVSGLAENLDDSVGSLAGELGLFMPFSLKDSVIATIEYIADNYLSYLAGANTVTMTKQEFEEEITSIAQSVAESVAYEIAQETADSVAREAAGSVAAETAEEVAKKIAEETVKKYMSSTPQSNSDSTVQKSDESSKTSDTGSKGKMYSEVAGNYIFEEGVSYGVTATAKFDNKGNYSFSCKSLLFNISDKGTYTVDDKGNITFQTNTSYKAKGVYSSGIIKLTIAGIATVELKKQ